MTFADPLLRRLGLGLVRLAVWLLPRGQADWASAMLAELQHRRWGLRFQMGRRLRHCSHQTKDEHHDYR